MSQSTSQLTSRLPSDSRSHDVFISYSRKDQAFVRSLDAAFRNLDRTPWVDWDSIQKGEQWWTAIQRGIEGANTFIFVISPDSIASSVCRDEVEYAAQCHKRFLPIVRREGFNSDQVHPSISSHNWLFFRETDNFDATFQELLSAIDTDLAYVRMHTRLLVRAVEWQDKAQDSSYLLRGTDLEAAEQWLIHQKKPAPTALQMQYIRASREAEVFRIKAIARSRRTIISLTILSTWILSVIGGIWLYKFSIDQTTDQIRQNLVRAAKIGAFGTNGDDFAALASLRVPPGTMPDNNPLYQQHQQWLLNIHTAFSSAFPRTYVAGESGQILWVGDVARVLPNQNASGFLKPFNAEHGERNVFDSLETVIMKPYPDKFGQWVSASEPIKDSRGRVVGGLIVYFTEDYLLTQRAAVGKDLLEAYLVIFVWLLILSWIILCSMRSISAR